MKHTIYLTVLLLGTIFQTVSAQDDLALPNKIKKGIEIKSYDDSILRISSGSSFAINQCSD